MLNLLVSVLRQTFEEKVGKFQVKQEQPKALLTNFRLTVDTDVEDGYRYLEVAIYAPCNYVQVWVREAWTVIPVEDLDYDDDGDATLKPGTDYDEGYTDWFLVADHDSGWTEGISRILRQYQNRITTFAQGSFYQVEEEQKFGFPESTGEEVRYSPEAMAQAVRGEDQ
jgi:hypothetical protein